MSNPADDSLQDNLSQLSDEASQRLLEACEKFESEWPGRDMAEILNENGCDRRLLLFHLVAIDMELRRRRGEDVDQELYLSKFPDDAEVVSQAFADTAVGGTVSNGDEATLSTMEPRHDSSPSTAPLNQDFGNYRLLAVIGQGGAGTVYRAKHLSTDRIVALKMLTGVCHTPEMRERFRREANAAANLDHPNILTVYDAGEHRGQPYIAMKCVEGRSLREVHEGPIHSELAATYIKDIATAVAYAHGNGLLHRDIKPANILIDSRQIVYLTDFGLAKAVDDGDSELTATGNILGTPSYMPPEQARGDLDAVDQRSDVYALGATLYALLAGHPPFRAPDLTSTLRQVMESDPVRLRQAQRDIDRNIETICMKCLEKDPSKRYASAQALADDLQRYLTGEPIHARPHSLVERSWRWCRRHRVAATLVAMLLLVIGLSVGLAAVQTAAARHNAALNQEAQKAKRLSQARQTQLEYERSLRASAMQTAQRRWNLATGTSNVDVTLKHIPGALASWDTKWLLRIAGEPLRRQANLAEGSWGIVASGVNPNGKLAITADASGLMLVWDIATGKVTQRLSEPRRTRLKMTDDSKEPGALRTLHHFEGRKAESSLLEWGRCFVALRWISDKEFVACSLNGEVVRFDATTGDDKTLARVEQPAIGIATSSKHVLVGDVEGGLTLLSLSGEKIASYDAVNSAVQTIAWSENSQRWLAGFADGQVIALDDKLERVGEPLQVPAPVWSLAIEQSDIAVGCGGSRVRIIQLEGEQLREARSLPAPQFSRLATAIHHVAYSGKRLYAADDLGRLTMWDMATANPRWSEHVATRHGREKIAEQAGENSKRPLPLPLQRTIVHIGELDEGRRLTTAGRDFVFAIWRVQEQVANPTRRLQVNVGGNPQIRYDSQQPGLLWCLDEDGWLWAVDAVNDKLLDRKQAHNGGAVDLAALPLRSGVASVGGDKALKQWTLQKGRIKAVNKKQFQHDAPLIGVAASGDGKFLAGVDDTGRLVVWNADSYRQVFLVSLNSAADSASRPLTGKVAFNKDSSLLCAFGSGQEAPIFSVDPFRRLNRDVWVSGKGGTSLVWNPHHPSVVIAGSDHRRLVVRAVDRKNADMERPLLTLNHRCMTLAATPDHRRIVALEEGGRIAFLEAEHHMQFLEMNHPDKLDSDLSIDPQGISIALAGRAGELEILDAEDDYSKPAAAPIMAAPIVDSSQAWKLQELAHRSGILRLAPQAMVFDRDNHLCLLVTESTSTNFRDQGEVFFLRSDGLRERIEIDRTESDRRITVEATAMRLGKEDQPVAFISRPAGKYPGNAWLVQRTGPNQWNPRKIFHGGNMGHYPAMRVDSKGNVAELIHFTFANFMLVRSYPNSDSDAPWTSHLMGRVGDGLQLRHRESKDGKLHFLYRWNPVNAIPTPLHYGQWDGKQWKREIIDSYAKVGPLRIGPEGDAVVMHSRDGKRKLLRRRNDAWEDYCDLPQDAPAMFDFGADDRLYVGPFWGENSQLLLWERVGEKWTLHSIAEKFVDNPRYIELLIDRQGEPLVLLGDVGQPFGWLKILRKVKK